MAVGVTQFFTNSYSNIVILHHQMLSFGNALFSEAAFYIQSYYYIRNSNYTFSSQLLKRINFLWFFCFPGSCLF